MHWGALVSLLLWEVVKSSSLGYVFGVAVKEAMQLATNAKRQGVAEYVALLVGMNIAAVVDRCGDGVFGKRGLYR
ncbi:hypothetical protein IAQ61_004352 [Plenodomus lingam]|uniref:uncharacterized protein n=1 Tax=Leptosphaeria maculans TaxID=5022 RepID=UPI00332A95C9|nr:hypothetical protein IAQ61_004352 [Plenodomus lingam]